LEPDIVGGSFTSPAPLTFVPTSYSNLTLSLSNQPSSSCIFPRQLPAAASISKFVRRIHQSNYLAARRRRFPSFCKIMRAPPAPQCLAYRCCSNWPGGIISLLFRRHQFGALVARREIEIKSWVALLQRLCTHEPSILNRCRV
jgi:hypothetical protein